MPEQREPAASWLSKRTRRERQTRPAPWLLTVLVVSGANWSATKRRSRACPGPRFASWRSWLVLPLRGSGCVAAPLARLSTGAVVAAISVLVSVPCSAMMSRILPANSVVAESISRHDNSAECQYTPGLTRGFDQLGHSFAVSYRDVCCSDRDWCKFVTRDCSRLRAIHLACLAGARFRWLKNASAQVSGLLSSIVFAMRVSGP